MVILIASDQFHVCQGLAERLREQTGHRLLTATTLLEMESTPLAEGALDILLFSPAFALIGKEARVRLRQHFPSVQTFAFEDELPLDQIVKLVIGWLPETTVAEDEFSPDRKFQPVAAVVETLGDYDLKSTLRTTEQSIIYKAVQRSVSREVELERLHPFLAKNEIAARDFRRRVRAQATVSHPAIAAVYEAHEEQGEIFYTRELVQGKNTLEWVAEEAHFSPQVLLQMLLTAGEAFTWMEEHNIPHDDVLPVHIYLNSHGTARIANIAQSEQARQLNVADSIVGLADYCLRLAEPNGNQTRELFHVLGLMKAQGPHALQSWPQLVLECRSALQRLTEAHSSLQPDTRKRILARRQSRLKQAAGVLVILAVSLAAVNGIAWWRQQVRAKVRDLTDTVLIPAGEFRFREGQSRILAAYDIDRYEVTLAEYSAFLDALPHGELNRFDHADQPPAKTGHLPREWSEVVAAGRAAGFWKGHPITLNVPVFNIDWWDAWAYAKWKGRRLPTEEEWEKAARGQDGNLWPWGQSSDPKIANLGSDYADQPSAGGKMDGHAWWCDVDAMPGDISVYGVRGMAGNVAEWTATLVPDPDLPDVQVPVFRGGDFHQTIPVPLNAEPWVAKNALYAQPFLGFRTVSLRPPP